MCIQKNPGWRHTAARAMVSVAWGVVFLTACAPSLKSQYADVARTVRERTGQSIEWDVNAPAPGTTDRAVGALLSQPLTESSAVRIALVNNRALQAALLEIGISRADLIQAGLLSNPELYARDRFRIDGKDGSNPRFYLAKDFVDILTLPMRRGVAKEQLEQAKARAGHAALDLACQVQIAFYTLQTQLQARDEQRRFVETLESDSALSRRKRLIGDMDDRALLRRQMALAESKHDLAALDLEIVADREALNRLMGLTGAPASAWSIAGELPPIPANEPPLENLETRAVADRMDLAAARQETETLKKALNLQQITRWVPLFKLGIDYNRELTGPKLLGPFLVIELPIFDWGQARIARAKTMLEQSRQRTAALETDIRSGVREARERVLAARGTAQAYRDEILPQAQKLAALEPGKAGVGSTAENDWLKDQQDAAKTRQAAIAALGGYWIELTRLEQALGGQRL